MRWRTLALACRELPFSKLVSGIAVLVTASVTVVIMSTGSDAAVEHRVTFVNNSGETLWIGSGVNGDGSHNIENLPVLADGETASLIIPGNDGPGYWRGKFFARQRCSGEPGSTFHCLVGDCGVSANRCDHGEQPASLAEFNFDRNDNLAPWYNVSYVNAMSLPMTITPQGADPSTASGSCANGGCLGDEMLAACSSESAQYDQATGERLVCVNPNRDGESAYTEALGAFQPRAYLWSMHDRVAGNSTVFNCTQCAEFVVTFHGAGSSAPRQQWVAPPEGSQEQQVVSAAQPAGHVFRGYVDKCIDVPGAVSADGAQLQLYECNGTEAQIFHSGPNGSEMILGKCMDVAWASTENGAKVQLAWCNGGPAQTWVIQGSNLVNPHSGKCVDVRDWNTENGAPLVIWDCHGGANQAWASVRPGA